MLLDLASDAIADVLPVLLKDRTTGKRIVFATDEYEGIPAETELDACHLPIIRPRVEKNPALRSQRTRKKAEVFTPSWICNRMNNHCDEAWFGRPNMFNHEKSNQGTWQINSNTVAFDDGMDWKDYVESTRLEITCGEAPYLVSRYDSSTGKPIADVKRRIGILDRKLRVVTENTATEDDWLEWTIKAFQSVYGYELQGDSLLIGRSNLLLTFAEYLEQRWHRPPTRDELERIADVIAWNLWQMDGLRMTVPFGRRTNPPRNSAKAVQLSLLAMQSSRDERPMASECMIYDWKKQQSIPFNASKESASMKFDFVIGNPPYQEEVENNGRANPIYDKFMDESFKLADICEFITPARFLFDAGQTPKNWNQKILCDCHFKVLHYESDASKIFSNTDIKGGVAITLRNARKNFGKIGIFTPYGTMNAILDKINEKENNCDRLNAIIASQGLYRFSSLFFEEHKDAQKYIGLGTGSKIVSNVMEKLPTIFLKDKQDGEYVRILGRISGQREYRFINKKYIESNNFISTYNVFFPEANSSGKFGEVLSVPEIGLPNDITADTYLCAGQFDNIQEAENLIRYFKTKFFRALLGVRKVTQHCPPAVWQSIPQQNFSALSDIRWDAPLHDIDRQLYVKYGLSSEEIDFIENNVKEME